MPLKKIKSILGFEFNRQRLIANASVVPDSYRCVQCGICSYSCPIGIDVRQHAWEGTIIQDNHCLTCGQCVANCPRSVLRLENVK